jgi:hypothetical protein
MVIIGYNSPWVTLTDCIQVWKLIGGILPQRCGRLSVLLYQVKLYTQGHPNGLNRKLYISNIISGFQNDLSNSNILP